jgi:hypothetical protein
MAKKPYTPRTPEQIEEAKQKYHSILNDEIAEQIDTGSGMFSPEFFTSPIQWPSYLTAGTKREPIVVKPFTGWTNVVTAMMSGYSTFVTKGAARQIAQLQAENGEKPKFTHPEKGSHSYYFVRPKILLWDEAEKRFKQKPRNYELQEGDRTKRVWVEYGAFPADKMVGLDLSQIRMEPTTEVTPISEQLESFYERIQSLDITITRGGNQPAYFPQLDMIQVPKDEQYFRESGVMADILHEANHGMCDQRRLNIQVGKAREEFIVETAGALWGRANGFVHDRETFDNSMNYARHYREQVPKEFYSHDMQHVIEVVSYFDQHLERNQEIVNLVSQEEKSRSASEILERIAAIKDVSVIELTSPDAILPNLNVENRHKAAEVLEQARQISHVHEASPTQSIIDTSDPRAVDSFLSWVTDRNEGKPITPSDLQDLPHLVQTVTHGLSDWERDTVQRNMMSVLDVLGPQVPHQLTIDAPSTGASSTGPQDLAHSYLPGADRSLEKEDLEVPGR